MNYVCNSYTINYKMEKKIFISNNFINIYILYYVIIKKKIYILELFSENLHFFFRCLLMTICFV